MGTRTPGTVAIVLAAGAGLRVGGDRPKAFLPIGGRPILAVATASAAAASSVDKLVVTVPAGWEDEARAILVDLDVPTEVVTGGPTRQGSVRAALDALEDAGDRPEVVVVHDAARPFAPPELFDDVVGALNGAHAPGEPPTLEFGAWPGTGVPADGAIPVVPVPDTVKRVEDGMVAGTVSREGLGLAQTPQAFSARSLRAAHEAALDQGLDLTDDAAVVEAAGGAVRAVTGDPTNVKITTFLDLARADARMGGTDSGDD